MNKNLRSKRTKKQIVEVHIYVHLQKEVDTKVWPNYLLYPICTNTYPTEDINKPYTGCTGRAGIYNPNNPLCSD